MSDGVHIMSFIQIIDGKRYLTLCFRRLLLTHEVSYLVEVSGDSVKWQPSTNLVGEPILNAGGTQTVTYRDDVPVNAGRRFMRLRVSRRPP